RSPLPVALPAPFPYLSFSTDERTTVIREKQVRLIFDRGTLLLMTDKDRTWLQSIPLAVWDSRVNAYRAPASSYASLLRGLREEDALIEDVVRHEWGETLRLIAPELRPYQQAALNSWTEAKGRGTIVLPTGAGKTVVAMAAIAQTRKSTLCLVPTRILLEQ